MVFVHLVKNRVTHTVMKVARCALIARRIPIALMKIGVMVKNSVTKGFVCQENNRVARTAMRIAICA